MSDGTVLLTEDIFRLLEKFDWCLIKFDRPGCYVATHKCGDVIGFSLAYDPGKRDIYVRDISPWRVNKDKLIVLDPSIDWHRDLIEISLLEEL